MQPVTYYCDAAAPLATAFGDYLEDLSEEQLIDLAEALAYFLRTGVIEPPWSTYIDLSWSVAQIKKALVAVAVIFGERPDWWPATDPEKKEKY